MLIEMRGIETNTGLLIPYYVLPWTENQIKDAFSGGKNKLQEYINPHSGDGIITYMPDPYRGAWNAVLKESWELGGNPAAYLGMNAGAHRLLAPDGSNSTQVGSTITISPTTIGWTPRSGYEIRLVSGTGGNNRWISTVDTPGGYSSGIRPLLRSGILNPEGGLVSGMPKTWVQTTDDRLITFSPYVDNNRYGWMYLIASTGFTGNPGASNYKTVHIKWIETDDIGGETMSRFQPRIKSGSIGAYLISGVNVDILEQFTTDLWETNLVESIKTAFIGDGRNALLGLRYFHGLAYSEDLVVPDSFWFIKLGNVTFDVSSLRSDSEYCSFNFGELVVPRSYGDYRDYTEVQYRAHLPFIGIVDLDPQEVVGKSVFLRYMVNLTDGMAIASLSNDANYPNSSGTFFSATCQWGYDVPLQVDAVRDVTSAGFNLGLRTVGGIAAGAAMGGALGAVAGGAVGAMSTVDANQAQSYSAGSLSPNANVMGDFEAKIVAYRREDLSGDIETSLGKAAGGNVKVGDLTGFAQFDVIYNGGILPMRHAADIISQLQEGIYINE